MAFWAEFPVAETFVLSTGAEAAPNGWCQALQLLQDPLELHEGRVLLVDMDVEASEASIRIEIEAKRSREEAKRGPRRSFRMPLGRGKGSRSLVLLSKAWRATRMAPKRRTSSRDGHTRNC